MLGFVVFTAAANGQTNATRVASEYSLAAGTAGDQTFSHVAFNEDGGWVVWQDNATDEDGFGISARRLNSSLSGEYQSVRVNENGNGDQERPKVALMNGGGAVVVWQGGSVGFQKIYARIVSASGVFVTGDVLVNTYQAQHQIAPSVAVLSNGNIVVVWSSYGQDGSMLGIYGQLLSPTGEKIGGEFRVNDVVAQNQRTPAVAAFSGGGFVVVWVSEKAANDTSRQFDIELVGKLFANNGTASSGELSLQDGAMCSDPSVISLAEASFAVGWGQRDLENRDHSWEVYYRSFNSTGAPLSTNVQLNADEFGDQFGVRLSVVGTNVFAVWSSMGHDGSQEGIYGRTISGLGQFQSEQVLVNTVTVGRQLQPAVAADQAGRFLVVWSSYVSLQAGYDLRAQRFAIGAAVNELAPTTLFAAATSSSGLSVRWPELAGYSVAFYELYLDGATSPIVVSGNHAAVDGLAPGSTHTVAVLYQLTDGRRSPLSSAVTAKTWALDGNGDGVPDDWQALYWGANSTAWPDVNSDPDGDGASIANEFQAGTNPIDISSVLRTRLIRSGDALLFNWNTEPGLVYQVQTATTLPAWQDFGAPRFAHSKVDALNLSELGSSKFFRVIRLR